MNGMPVTGHYVWGHAYGHESYLGCQIIIVQEHARNHVQICWKIMKCSIKLFRVFNVANTYGSMMHLLDVHLHACRNLGCNQWVSWAFESCLLIVINVLMLTFATFESILLSLLIWMKSYHFLVKSSNLKYLIFHKFYVEWKTLSCMEILYL